jgi:hypothetical protein
MSSLSSILLSPASSATIQVLRQQFACILLTHMILNLRSSFATWSPSFFHSLSEGEWITQIVVQVTISGQSMYIASFQEWACLKFSGPYDLVRLSTTANWSPFTKKAMGENPYLNRSLWCSNESFYNFLQCAHTSVHVAWRMGESLKTLVKNWGYLFSEYRSIKLVSWFGVVVLHQGHHLPGTPLIILTKFVIFSYVPLCHRRGDWMLQSRSYWNWRTKCVVLLMFPEPEE